MAAQRGIASAQYNLGLYYERGRRGLTQSFKRACKYYTLAANQKHAKAQFNLGVLYYNGNNGVEQSDSKARELWTKAAAQGKEEAIKYLKLMDEQEKRNTLISEPVQEAEDKENCPICTDALPKLGSKFKRYTCCGKGLHNKCAKDLVENKSMTLEQKNTCIMCRTKLVGNGSKELIERLRKWVDKGKAWAMGTLAHSYIEGVGVKQSSSKAIELFEMAAQRGNASAQYSLGFYYHNGSHGLTQSSKRAIEYYTLAAEQGHASAQFNLGVSYYQGQGIETSFSKAREWLTKAAAQGQEDAIKYLKQLDEHGC